MATNNSEEDLVTICWQWAGGAMVACQKIPGLWEKWLKHEATLDNNLTDSKVGKEFVKFVEANGGIVP